jgi:Flp pilus assembly protein TadG
MRKAIRAFATDGRGNAALEFAFIAPVLVALLLGVYEICNAVIVYEEVQNAAHAIPVSASSLAVHTDGETNLTYAQVQLLASEVWSEIPELRSGFQNDTKSVTITSVTFLPTYPPAPPVTQTVKPANSCTPIKGNNCNYTPTVAWSVAYTGGDSGRTFTTALRSCTGKAGANQASNATVEYTNPTTNAISYQQVPGALTASVPQVIGVAANSAVAGDLTALPVYLLSQINAFLAPPSPVIVVDIHLKYHPVFGLFIKSTGIDFYASGFFPVRSVRSAVISAAGVTTTQTLSQQFTTLYDTATNGVPDALTGVDPTTYCINSSLYLNPPAVSEPAS